MEFKYWGFLLLAGSFLLSSCNSGSHDAYNFNPKNREYPEFNADSAYQFIKQQVEMGPRNPGSAGHREALDYLATKLKAYAGAKNVYVQHFTHTGYNDTTLHLANIIAAFNPQAADRIMLCAHWDTRPRADQDSSHPNQSILGADDGGSGVAVLLELARLFREQPPPIGVDIILFDGEDYGKENDLDQFFLGSRYWAKHPPVKNYHPRFGILLDMVGGVDAQFPKEGNSYNYAPGLVNGIWDVAAQMGYGSLFVNKKGRLISDDHIPIINHLQIPVVDIINYSADPKNKNSVFPPYWHTTNDNMSIISKRTLKDVGSVMAELIYNRL